MYTDQTGSFPYTLSHGYNCQLSIHKINGSSIWVKPMKDKTQGEMIKAHRAALVQITIQGSIPVHQLLDNNISETPRKEIKDTDTTYTLVSPDNHHQT